MSSKNSKLSSHIKNRTNPFVEDAIEKINQNIVKKYKSSTNTGEKAILQAIDPASGELLGHTSFVRQIEVDEERFTKLYLSQFSQFWDLQPQSMRVFGYIMTQLKPKQDMFIFLLDDCLEHTGYKSKTSVFKGLGGLIDSKIIARGPSDSLYFINPMVAFNGSRVTFAKTYVKKKKAQQDPNQATLNFTKPTTLPEKEPSALDQPSGDF
jgi:hypothetical protein